MAAHRPHCTFRFRFIPSIFLFPVIPVQAASQYQPCRKLSVMPAKEKSQVPGSAVCDQPRHQPGLPDSTQMGLSLIHICINWDMLKNSLAELAVQILSTACATPETVSYTHLDVYKRQSILRSFPYRKKRQSGKPA